MYHAAFFCKFCVWKSFSAKRAFFMHDKILNAKIFRSFFITHILKIVWKFNFQTISIICVVFFL
jgi:hypothetical protein